MPKWPGKWSTPEFLGTTVNYNFLSQNKFFDLSTPVMRRVDDGSKNMLFRGLHAAQGLYAV